MPVSFTRLRIAGFKSFPEPATLEILPGLTGIVGPNGCGKSNVVEALRWVMGEGSARSLRGGEMDDVIFAGTAHRPSRNIAEVTIGLEQTQGLAPPPFQDAPELEIVRRIERAAGSSFRVNGREARARDVQTLFADLATGARASAMVSQGRVGALVAARPEERRGILEEAAGITGLHARRHEAELKLRAAEANLARAEDLAAQLATHLEALKRQAKQAARFRTVNETVRTAEAELLSLQRALARQAQQAAARALAEAAGRVSEATARAAHAGAAAATAQAALPPLRSVEAEARTALERARLGAEQAEAEAARARAALEAAQQRGRQVARDLAHADQAGRDAQSALQRLQDEATRLAAEAAEAPARVAAAQQAAAEAAEALHAAEAAAEAAIAHAASLTAQHRAATETWQSAEQRVRRLSEQSERLAREREQAEARIVQPDRLAAASAAHAAAEQEESRARMALEQADAARAAAQHALATAREQAGNAEAARTRLAAAAQGLAEAMGRDDRRGGPRILDELEVPAGLEAALGAALGDTLEATTDAAAARRWAVLPPYEQAPALPESAEAVASLVSAPPALARALSQIGLVESEAAGAALQPSLAPGQMLVSRAGALWRSDGYCVQAGAPSPAAVRLQQRNRLAALRAELAVAETAASSARAERATAEQAEREAVQGEQQARAALRQAQQHAARSREEAGRLQALATRAAAEFAALGPAWDRLQAELAEAQAELAAVRQARAAMAEPAAARDDMERARAALTVARKAESEARSQSETLSRAATERSHRQTTLIAELADWQDRAKDARLRVTDLTARAAEAAAELADQQAAPEAVRTRQAEALEAARGAEQVLREAADALSLAESQANEADRAARRAEAEVAAAREAQVRAEGAAAQADQAGAAADERIAERLGASPALPDPPASLDAEMEERLRRRLERLQRERESFGPVNLRAEIEAAEIEAQAETIAREGADLSTAIAKLRGSIGHINREGRERLNQVFADIDRHFRSLFETMFGGGRAHLALVGSDDPLQAGLEIYAQPPGKKLATLSLLSGGEQALTALSLIFAVFRCNPAPVCVLDEVDAPLDDINVDRFCGLLEAMVRDTGTRFLIITHHQLTMSRMDRLYGVTMQERGVSRLLSVDLSRAAALVEPERMAAE